MEEEKCGATCKSGLRQREKATEGKYKSQTVYTSALAAPIVGLSSGGRVPRGRACTLLIVVVIATSRITVGGPAAG